MEHKKNTHRKALAICRKELDSRTDNFVRFPFQMRDTSIVDMEWTSGRWIELQSGVYRCTTVFSFGFLVHSVLPQLFFKHRFPCFWNEQSFQYVDSYCLYHNHCISESISSVEYPHRDDVQRGKQEYLKKEQ